MEEIPFIERLEKRVREINSLLCVGLDPHPEDLPHKDADAAKFFCLELIEETKEAAAAFKPNSAFFEIYGAEGMTALKEIIEAIPSNIPVVLDAKRGDISSTAKAYAKAAFETYRADAVTISPYLGFDAVEPFIDNPYRGAFMLCKTSNPGSQDFQELSTQQGLKLYEVIAESAQRWNTNNNLGLVVGATHPEALARVRSIAPDLWILAPGIGAQGGKLNESIQAGLRSDGMGMLFPVSRGISRASDPSKAAVDIRDALNNIGDNIQPEPRIQKYHSLAEGLFNSGCIKFGDFTLKSGIQSPVYIDLRRLVSNPQLLSQIAHAFLPILDQLTFDHIAPLPYAALPIGTTISLQANLSMVYPRKELKDYGTKAQIEGVYSQGDKVVVIDDLTTTGGSKFEAITKLTQAGLAVNDVVVLIDRESGAREKLSGAGYTLHSVFSLTELSNSLYHQKAITLDQHNAVDNFLKAA